MTRTPEQVAFDLYVHVFSVHVFSFLKQFCFLSEPAACQATETCVITEHGAISFLEAATREE